MTDPDHETVDITSLITEYANPAGQQLAERKMLYALLRRERRLMADVERLTRERDFSRTVLNRARTWAESTPPSNRSADRHLRQAIQDYEEDRFRAAIRAVNQREGTYISATYTGVGQP